MMSRDGAPARRPPELNPDKSPPLLLTVNELLCVVNNLYKSVHAADASGHTRLRDVCVEISNVRATMKILPIKVYIREI